MPGAVSDPILDAYVRYTFVRVHVQERIAEVARLACFNTGLLTPSQEEIFGVFRLSDRYDHGEAGVQCEPKMVLDEVGAVG